MTGLAHAPVAEASEVGGDARRAGVATRRVETPIGPLRLVAGPEGLRAVLWPGEDGSRVHDPVVRLAVAPDSGEVGVLEPGDPSETGVDTPPDDPAKAHLDRTESQLSEYFAGTRRDFDLVLAPEGTTFQRSAWDVLRTIPFGSTMSYRDQAACLGDAAKARAVGSANGRNPISVIVPCHRVVAVSGALTGFAGGLGTKAWLLEHERAVLGRR